mmetsp:Transcript_7123/g.17727  ORF Transcript_7123/g.17727 Transcript_7123/m.17727 type:complete len:366 (+) Transcript_7123:508-1605(+)
MTSYARTSTRACLARSVTLSDTCVLNARTIPSEAAARSTSDSVTSPAAVCRKRRMTRSWGSAPSAALTASTDPLTSVLTMRLITCTPSWSPFAALRLDRLTVLPSMMLMRASSLRFSAMSRAPLSVSITSNSSPAMGTPPRPMICTGVDGPASSSLAPYASVMARTLPQLLPTSTASPMRRVPVCTSSVAMAPRCLSRYASTTVPRALRSGLATSSSTSAVSAIVSKSWSMPIPVLALTPIMGTSPPHSSHSTSRAANSSLTRSGLAPSLSILLTAMMRGTPAANACATASRVCGRTPSSAATTTMAMSVTRAPRARMALKASCPGVSRNVMLLVSSPMVVVTWYAPMACVIPPASPAATFAFRM